MKRYGPDTQERIFESMGRQVGPQFPVSVEAWKRRARQVLPRGPYDYVAGAAGGEDTMRANREAFTRWRLRPRVLCDISERDLSVKVLGHHLELPFLLAPIGVMSIVHPEAERAPARAAARAGIPYVLSNVSTCSMEEVAREIEDAARWFQLYPPIDRELARRLVQRAERAGYSVLVVTLDSALLGWRERDLRNAFLPALSNHGLGNYLTDPVFKNSMTAEERRDMKQAVKRILDEGNNTRCTWEYIDFLRNQTDLPIVLKGITHPADANLAIKHGVDGIIVSNHGGRQLDGGIATLDALAEIVDAVEGQLPILMDGGVRRGADVLKALALGANAVLVGRPFVYALAVGGEKGVGEFIDHLAAEIDLQLGLLGRGSIGDLDRSMLQRC